MESSSIKFPGLNGLRFIAATAVFWGHVEQIKNELHLSTLWNKQWMMSLPAQGVTLFFVLSGFLITHRLLEERAATGHINIPRFYARRALRIFPLYYAVLALSFLLLLYGPWSPDTEIGVLLIELKRYLAPRVVPIGLLHIFFLPQIALVYFQAILFLSPLWSIGVEEQFYVFWPWIVRRLKQSGWIFLGLVLLREVVWHAYGAVEWLSGATPPDWLFLVSRWANLSFLHAFAIGGAAAWLLAQQHPILRYIIRPKLGQWSLPLLIILLLSSTFLANGAILVICCYAVLILNTVHAQRGSFVQWGWVEYLGRISYGIYLLHSFAIVGICFLMERMGWISQVWQQSVLFPLGSYALTILMAIASYEGVERPFLDLKKRFSAS